MGFTTHLFKCKYCEEKIIYTSKQKHPHYSHNCKLKERKQMEPNDFHQMYQILHDKGCKITYGDQYEYWTKRIRERIQYLTPLMNELKQKGISLATLSKELHQEWIELLEAKEYYNM
jgi:hypothetical protein